MVLTVNNEKDSVRQADMRLRTIQPQVYEKHPNYKKDYMKEWNKKHPNYKKERKRSIKRIIEGVDLAVLSESDKRIFREIGEAIRKESASKHDGW